MQQLGRRGRRSEGFGAGPYELSADAWSEAVRGWWGPLRSVGVGSVSVWKQSGLDMLNLSPLTSLNGPGCGLTPRRAACAAPPPRASR